MKWITINCNSGYIPHILQDTDSLQLVEHLGLDYTENT